MSRPKIRPAIEDDADAIHVLAEDELGRCPAKARLRAIVSQYPSLVLQSGDKVVGFVYGTQMAPDIIELGNMLVAEQFRNQGLGSDLLTAFEELSRSTYTCVVLANSDLWSVKREPKISAVPFYERAGYAPILTTSHSTVLAKWIRSPDS